ncbi:hypothetical protein DPX16_19957 [Anabarilius grahami]|uniref:Uncharacterized protein n=1 Tax=Anabarilius grahami TaxID=495550 RepID=A0A3N0Z0J8_ANAGA|nr:hypothetical protein DPX16_19957 [Anabarilius grahami]
MVWCCRDSAEKFTDFQKQTGFIGTMEKNNIQTRVKHTQEQTRSEGGESIYIGSADEGVQVMMVCDDGEMTREELTTPQSFFGIVLVASIKRRSQRLYKDTDGNKGRARIRRKIREEKGILTSVVEKYNRMVPSTESLCMETILSDSVDLRTKRRAFDIIMSVRRLEEELKILVAEMDHHWKSLSTRADTLRELSRMFASETMRNSPCGLSEEGLKGLQSIILRKQHKVREMKVQARDCYLQVLSGEGNINFLYSASADEYDSDCEMSDDGL